MSSIPPHKNKRLRAVKIRHRVKHEVVDETWMVMLT